MHTIPRKSIPLSPRAQRHLLVPPSAQTPSLFLGALFLRFSSSLVQPRYQPPTYISLFIPNSLPNFFSPCLFSQIHKPQQFQIPWLCTFSKPHFEKKKQKLITPPTHELVLGKCKAKRKHKEENGRFTRIFSPPLLPCINSQQRGTTAALSTLEPDVSEPTAPSQSDERAAGGQSRNDSVGWEPDLKRR